MIARIAVCVGMITRSLVCSEVRFKTARALPFVWGHVRLVPKVAVRHPYTQANDEGASRL